ncbi:chemotaxis protein CheA [Desulfobacter postgatei]|uniref:Chemotaxis protein CheA n=1 Tax=Desulfobacter postgatei 2ac9 TaxID=879212 RepID=I5B656_9BACT|nr:chemotaxis protein CheA [Desulfobacter postgatei]EIM64969.1 chemotaxis protein histidine kinase-like protein [Desulfobacter postgatei 2ac9]
MTYETIISTDEYSELSVKLNELSILIAGFCPGEIPDLGLMLNNLDDLINIAKGIDPATFYDISKRCKNYVEKMILKNLDDTKPVEEGVALLKSILCYLKKGEPFTFDYADVLEMLEENLSGDVKEQTAQVEKKDANDNIQNAPEKISDDDMEILTDFISEAQENLDTIEVSLIELEHDPVNTDIINDIFRPFHTIKGVAGFLSLTKINTLAHATENLLDSARSGDFIINHTVTDIILASVDTLKALLDKVKQGIQTGYRESDDDIDVDSLRSRLKQLQISLTKGEKEPLGEILVRKKELSQSDLDQALEIQNKHSVKKLGEILVEEKKVKPKQVASALMEQSCLKKKIDVQVRVSTQKLDDLVDYAGELVIAQSMLRQQTKEDAIVSKTVSQLGQIVNHMQNIAMSMRMIPIQATFMKMIRLVRDLSRKSGKEIHLSMTGEDTEIDRNVVDALYEPMVHMIRNACDHGIEATSERSKTGKPAQGNIHLCAYHKGGNIIIEIEDDGKGLDKDKILEKAKSTGLIKGDEQMTDTQVFDLIMQPGFSTAKEITDISGRGVGMDVVKDGIEKFRGHLNIASKKGKGTKFIISLPLTLAIIDGMLIGVDDQRYVIPTIAIQKAFKPRQGEYFTVKGKGEMVKDRGNLIPLIRLNEIYGTSNNKKSIDVCLVVVVESKEEKKAILIDELLGKDEYVIKSLGNSMNDIQGIAGGAILADGKVGLILDVDGIFSIVAQRPLEI